MYKYSLPHDTNTNRNDVNGTTLVADASTYEAIIIEDDFAGPKTEATTVSWIPPESEQPTLPTQPSRDMATTAAFDNSNETNFTASDAADAVQTAYNVTVDSRGRTKVTRIGSRRQPPPAPSGGRAMPGYTQSFRFIDRMLSKKKNRAPPPQSNGGNVQADKIRPNGHVYGKTGRHLIPGRENEIPDGNDYKWEITGYTPCSKPCGGGIYGLHIEILNQNHCLLMIQMLV